MAPKTHYDVIVIGGGAAGMMCALTAGQRGRKVALLEHNDRVGKKIGISGGGRCNFTNLGAGPGNYLSGNPDFCRSALARYTPWDFLALVDKHGIGYHEKRLGQQFCNTSSRAIIEMLIAECAEARVTTRCGCSVYDVQKTDAFQLRTSLGDFESDSLVIASGSLSFAKLGATGFGHEVARKFGLRITKLRPGLVPLTLPQADLAKFRELSGLSLPVRATANGQTFDEAILFTHRGMSGPAILQVSSYWDGKSPITFDLLPDISFSTENHRGSLATLLSRHWPNRFAETWSELHVPKKPVMHYKQRELRELGELLHRWPVEFSGTEGYPKAEVTLGGVDTSDLSSKTMEARKVPGLYFIGEVVDVTGWLGGYNFQWAWASGNAAGLVV